MGQRRRAKPGDPQYHGDWLGEVFIEWGEGEVLDRAQPPGRAHELHTAPARADGRNAVVVIKPGHLEHPMGLTIDTRDASLPKFVRDDPRQLIGHTIGYRAVVRRTQAFVQSRPDGLSVPIDQVRGSADGARFKVRELIEVVEIDQQDPQSWAPLSTIRQAVDEHDPATWPNGSAAQAMSALSGEYLREPAADHQHAVFGEAHAGPRHGKLAPGIFGAVPDQALPVEVKVHALRVADRAIGKLDRWLAASADPGENYGTFREFVFVLVERVLAQIEADFDDQQVAFVLACDLIEGALACYLPRARLPLDEIQLDQLEAKVIDFATDSYRQLLEWPIH